MRPTLLGCAETWAGMRQAARRACGTDTGRDEALALASEVFVDLVEDILYTVGVDASAAGDPLSGMLYDKFGYAKMPALAGATLVPLRVSVRGAARV